MMFEELYSAGFLTAILVPDNRCCIESDVLILLMLTAKR
jgi:hypothetical protein